MSDRDTHDRDAYDARRAAVSRAGKFTLPSGRTVEFGQLGLVDFRRLEDMALEEHKRRLIKTWTDNVDLLPESMRVQAVTDAMAKASQLTVADLGTREMEVPITRGGKIQFDEQENVLTRTQRVPYAAWWMSETVSGRLNSVWLSMRNCPSQSGMTFDEAADLFQECMTELEEAAQIVGSLSESHLARAEGNSRAPGTETTPAPGVTAAESTGPCSSATSARDTQA